MLLPPFLFLSHPARSTRQRTALLQRSVPQLFIPSNMGPRSEPARPFHSYVFQAQRELCLLDIPPSFSFTLCSPYTHSVALHARCSHLLPPLTTFSSHHCLPAGPLASPTDIIKDIMEKVSNGELKPTIRPKVYSLDKIRQAHRSLSEASMGKVVIRM